MKKLVLILIILLFTSQSFAVPLEGFWGYSWDSSREDIKTSMAKKNIKPDVEDSTGFMFNNISFAGRKGSVIFLFYKDSFYLGGFNKVASSSKALAEYKALKKDLIIKYGDPSADEEIYEFPYEKENSDRDKEAAILLNRATIRCLWTFDNSYMVFLGLDNDENLGVILKLLYMNTDTLEIVRIENSKKDSEDL